MLSIITFRMTTIDICTEWPWTILLRYLITLKDRDKIQNTSSQNTNQRVPQNLRYLIHLKNRCLFGDVVRHVLTQFRNLILLQYSEMKQRRKPMLSHRQDACTVLHETCITVSSILYKGRLSMHEVVT
jgi:hypothetical protein